ncbi:MAG: protocatechuate 3,4-dioxygenase [Sphingobium sp.]|nr:MAG: protocatechuate 3,4-dioxygenase [Sphingobium sp.]
MAEIVLGIWTTHGPTLSTTPDEWLLRLSADHKNTAHPFRGGTYDFDTLVEMRKDEGLTFKSSREERVRRHGLCQKAVGKLAEIFAESRPDVAVIFGNDQNELFRKEAMVPAFTIFNGSEIWNQPSSEDQIDLHPPGIHAAEWGHKPSEFTTYPGHPELANLMLRHLTREGFDFNRASELPRHEDHWHSGIGHAFGFIYRQIMRDKVVPNVPIIANTFFPPNQPTAKRMFQLGQAVGEAIRKWDSDARVAVFGSGGMSHFVIDEEVDQAIFKAIAERDADYLMNIDEQTLQSGTSELKNWIGAAGCLFDTGLSGGVVDYVPCYRSEAGTGTANGFVAWY